MKIEVISADAMQALGAQVGALLQGGEVIVLIGDIGAGKTTFTKGLARALGVDEDVQSPTFTINRIYDTSTDLVLSHYDFYRLQDAGVLKAELAESVSMRSNITVIEWAEVVADVLPTDSLQITLHTQADDSRIVEFTARGDRSHQIVERLS